MSFEEALQPISLPANADLSAKQYYAIEVANASGEGRAALAGDGEYAIGILQNKPAAGEAANVAIGGVSKAVAGGTITAGGAVGVDANGKLVAAATGDHRIGIALMSAVSGDIFPVLIQQRGTL